MFARAGHLIRPGCLSKKKKEKEKTPTKNVRLLFLSNITKFLAKFITKILVFLLFKLKLGTLTDLGTYSDWALD